MELYEPQAAAILKEAGSEEALLPVTEEYDVLGTSIWSRYRYGESKLQISTSLDAGGESIERGLLVLLLLLGRSHAALARLPGTRDFTRVRHLRVAAKVFDVLVRSQYVGKLTPKSFEEELNLNYAVVLAELGEVSAAIAVVRKMLSQPYFEDSSRLLHLMALLVSAGGDDPQSLGAAAALCKKASELSPSALSIVRSEPSLLSLFSAEHSSLNSIRGGRSGSAEEYSSPGFFLGGTNRSPNARLSLALLELTAGNVEVALRSVDGIVASALVDFRNVIERQHRIREAVIATAMGTSSSSSSSHQASAQHTTPGGGGGGHNSAGDTTEEAMKDPGYSAATLRGFVAACKQPPNLTATDCAYTVRLLVDILIACSRLYKSGGKYIKARASLEEAWKLMFTPTSETLTAVAEMLLDGSKPQHSGTDKKSKMSKGSGGSGGGAAHIGAHVDEFRRVDLLRKIPTLTGWRLSEASGWDVPGYPDLQAAILCEAALQTENTDTAVQLLQSALAFFPEHAASYVALADIELTKIENAAAVAAASKKSNEEGGGIHIIGSGAESDLSRPLDIFSQIVDPLTDGGGSDHNGNGSEGIEVGRRGGSTGVNERSQNGHAVVNEQGQHQQQGQQKQGGGTKALAPLTRETKAYEYAVSAVRIRDLSAEVWYSLGRVYQALGMAEPAAEALTTSLELVQISPLREYSTVLLDPLLQRSPSTLI
jgi:tetratricopeptide (TPR) repeat protein